MFGLFNYYFVIFPLVVIVSASSKEGYCTKESCPADIKENGSATESSEKWRYYTDEIRKALKGYQHCTSKNCSCYTDLVDSDLIPFSDGINEALLDKARERGTKYQIIDHKLYRDKDCMFPSRCSGIEHFILKVIKDIPDLEMVVNTRDWAQSSKHFGTPLPIFSFSKTRDYYDITYPAWTFWEGGPAISLYPKGLGRWDLHRKSLSEAAAEHPWSKKQNKGFFRGSRTSSERDSLVLLSREYPDLVDATYTKNQAWKSNADTLGAPPVKEVSLESHCAYKYLFNYRGVAASFRFKHLFLCSSLVFHVGDEWIEFFYPAMKPWVHYIPVASNVSQRELRQLLEFARENDSLVSKIAARGRAFVWDHLKMSDIECYWRYLLSQYAKHLTFEPKLDRQLIRIH